MAQITLNQPIAEIHGALSKPRPLFFESVRSFSQITFGYLSYYPATCFAFASGLANVSFTQFSLPLPCFRKRLRSKKCTFLLFSLARVKKK